MTPLATHGRDQRHDAACFCTHCGVVTDDAPQRVCAACGRGVVLSCPREAAPRPDAPFLVVTTDLRVSAASAAVARLLGRPDELIGRSVLDLVRADDAFRRQVARAAMGSRKSATAWVRTNEHSRPYKTRIVTCGDPPAALVVLS
jgi:PAS domain-containing protein